MKEILPFNGVERSAQLTRLGLVVGASLLVAKVLSIANNKARTRQDHEGNARMWVPLEFTHERPVEKTQLNTD